MAREEPLNVLAVSIKGSVYPQRVQKPVLGEQICRMEM